jgi:hypothetical protein
MGLASIIRLEFAYPGVGVLAGDSLQYLSIATAHGVIMVFFMIMPLLFGAFGNFLLPTQLGVHDVAFPRLNSAAFWFLPGGLIMLCQLVCVDRRYQRMNCFNIRELQGILKRRFFTDLVNTNDFRALMDDYIIGLRFKANNDTLNTNSALLIYKYGITTTPKTATTHFGSVVSTNSRKLLSTSSADFEILSSLQLLNITAASAFLQGFIRTIFNMLPSYAALPSLAYLPFYLKTVILVQLNPQVLLDSSASKLSPATSMQNSGSNEFTSDVSSIPNTFDSTYMESSSFRNLRFSNPIISYDYKCGNYIRI